MQHIYDSDGNISHKIVGDQNNEVAMTNPLHNVRPACVIQIYDYFNNIKNKD
jgi:hypothetical protein